MPKNLGYFFIFLFVHLLLVGPSQQMMSEQAACDILCGHIIGGYGSSGPGAASPDDDGGDYGGGPMGMGMRSGMMSRRSSPRSQRIPLRLTNRYEGSRGGGGGGGGYRSQPRYYGK